MFDHYTYGTYRFTSDGSKRVLKHRLLGGAHNIGVAGIVFVVSDSSLTGIAKRIGRLGDLHVAQ